jgi:hypothetical protein
MSKFSLGLIVGLLLLILAADASAAADLFVSEFSLNPSTPTQGSPVSVRIGVYNIGNEKSAPFTVQWWPGENYQAPACTWRVDGLVARGGKILTCTYDGYPSWYSSLVTKSVVDSSGEVAESNESNNIYKQTISVNKPGGSQSPGSQGTPDLYVSEFSLTPSTPVQGSPVSVRIGVYNKGTAVSGPFTVQWWPGENYQAPACTWAVDSLVASGGRILTCTYAGYPSWYGSLVTKSVVDSSNSVAESDESNNIYKQTISVNKPGGSQSPGSQGTPDLYVSEFSLTPSTPVQGSPVSVRIGVYNKGTAASGPFTVQWWPGENYQAPSCTWAVDGLVASGGRILTCTYAGYPSWYANLVTKSVVDSSNSVAESDESNNVYKQTISVNKP